MSFSADSYLLLSFYDCTRLVKIDDKGGNLRLVFLEDNAIEGLKMHEPTIAFSNVSQRVKGQDGKAQYVNSSLAVQVTASCLSLLELDKGLQSYVECDTWKVKENAFEDPSAEIVAASINSSQIVLAVSGGKKILLSVAENKKLRVNLLVFLSI